jgi:surface carbohydrate biosynthesis protein
VQQIGSGCVISRMKFFGPHLNKLEHGLAKILRWFKLFLLAKKTFRRLPYADIAVFDTFTAEHLCKILENYSIFTIDVRGESFHLSILIESISKYILLRGQKKLGILYYSTYLDRLSAKVCITNQDANTIFFDLARENSSIKFIALQQGLKIEDTIGSYSEIFGDYHAFGSAYADKLKNGKANIIIAGSSKANSVEFELGRYKRIAYISSYIGHPSDMKVLRNYSYAEFVYPPIYSILKLVDSFCTKNKIDLTVVSKSSRNRRKVDRDRVIQSENRLFNNVLGKEANINIGNSYKVAGESKLVVCDQSALGYELLGCGCRVVFLNFIAYFTHQPSYSFGWPLELPGKGPFWCNIPDHVYIENMLKNIWNMSQCEWDEIAMPYKDKLMFYDKGNTILHGKLEAILDSSENKENDIR